MGTAIPINDTLAADPDAIVARIVDPGSAKGEIMPPSHQLRPLAPVHRSGIERLRPSLHLHALDSMPVSW